MSQFAPAHTANVLGEVSKEPLEQESGWGAETQQDGTHPGEIHLVLPADLVQRELVIVLVKERSPGEPQSGRARPDSPCKP